MFFLILLPCFCTLEYALVIVVKLTMKSWGMRGEKGKMERRGEERMPCSVRDGAVIDAQQWTSRLPSARRYP